MDEAISNLTWECSRCHRKYFDADIIMTTPNFKSYEHFKESSPLPIEPKDYWLGDTEPICEDCAVASGIPSVEEEEKYLDRSHHADV